AATPIYTLSLHDALPIYRFLGRHALYGGTLRRSGGRVDGDRRARRPVPHTQTPATGAGYRPLGREMHPGDRRRPKLPRTSVPFRSEEHTSELQSRENLVC